MKLEGTERCKRDAQGSEATEKVSAKQEARGCVATKKCEQEETCEASIISRGGLYMFLCAHVSYILDQTA